MTTSIRLTYFSRSVVLAVAEEMGFLEERGLAVRPVQVTSSPHQFGLISEGSSDLALTSPDNVAAYGLGDDNPLGRRLPVRMLLGLDGGLGLSVMGAPDIAALGDLRGRRVGVDVPESGFALALFAVLASHGLRAGVDYEVVSLGSTPRRRSALLERGCDATLLNAGHDLAAEADGCHRLARVTDHHRPYLGAVLAASTSWLDQHEDVARRFADAWLAAVTAIFDRSRDGEVLAAAVPALGLGEPVARMFLSVLRSPADGLVADGTIGDAALDTVMGLRGLGPGAAAGLVDPRLLQRTGR